MDIRLITVKEDFEKAFSILDNRNYPLSFYEFTLKHDQFHQEKGRKLIGLFIQDECLGYLSYQIENCPYLDRILVIKEIQQTTIGSYKALMDFTDIIAKDENCRAIKISKTQVDKLNTNLFDKFENFLKRIIH